MHKKKMFHFLTKSIIQNNKQNQVDIENWILI